MSDDSSAQQPAQPPTQQPAQKTTLKFTPSTKRRNTKERIIDEAENLAAIHGIEHLKLQDVADRIGIKLPSVYAHFSGREDILTAMAARINRIYSQLYHKKPEETDTETLHRGAHELLEKLAIKPAYFRLILRDLSVPIGYNPQNRRFNLNNSHSISPELKELKHRTDQLLSKIDNDNPINGEEFVVALHGMLLVELSWADTQPPTDDDKKIIDIEKSKARLSNLLTRLLH